MSERIRVTIGPTGKTTVAVEGVAGPACQDLTRELERRLGTVTQDTPTADMYAEQGQQAKQ